MINELKARVEQKKRIDAEVCRLFDIFKSRCEFHVTLPIGNMKWDKCLNTDGHLCNIKNCELLRGE